MKGIAPFGNRGLHLKDFRHEGGDIRNSVIPSVAVYPLLQHSGTPAERLVSVGDRVEEGMLIARESGELSSPVHSSIPGVVRAIRTIRLPNGERSEAVVVRLEGEFGRSTKSESSASDSSELSREELLGLLRERGLVTLDADSIPLHVQWRLPKGKGMTTLILNVLSDEPYLSVEEKLAHLRPEAVAQGLRIAIRILEPSRVVLVREGTEVDGEPPALDTLVERVVADAGKSFSVKSMGHREPRGGPRELVRSVTGAPVPTGSSTLDCGVVMTNASTLVAVEDAVAAGKPLIERYVTVSGGALAEPATLRVRIGTRIGDLIDECGGLREFPNRIVSGGPLTGAVVYDLDTPVIKNTQGIVALTDRESDHGGRAPCISCGRCLSACPEELNPAKIFKLVERARYSKAVSGGLFECSECGGCSLVCPSHIPLLEGLRVGKRLARRAGSAT